MRAAFCGIVHRAGADGERLRQHLGALRGPSRHRGRRARRAGARLPRHGRQHGPCLHRHGRRAALERVYPIGRRPGDGRGHPIVKQELHQDHLPERGDNGGEPDRTDRQDG